MSLADYNLLFIDPNTGLEIDMVDNRRLISLQYNRKLNDVGVMSLTILATDRMAMAGSLNTPVQTTTNLICDIYRNPGTGFVYEDSYLIRSVQTLEQNNTDYLILSGVHVLDFLKGTLIIPNDDPLASNGYSTKIGQVDAVMKALVDEQCVSPFTNINRTRAYIHTGPLNNEGLTVKVREQYSVLLEVLQAVAVQGQLDFTLERTSGANWLFTPQTVGGDFTKTSNYPTGQVKVFSPNRKNITDPVFMTSRLNESNVVWVGTQGIEEDRLFGVQTSGTENLALNRREVVVDAREIEDDATFLDSLTTTAQAELRTRQPLIEFTFEVDTNAPGGRYGRDWFLGDKVTATYLGYTQDVRFVQVDITAEVDSETITPTLQQLVN